MLNNSFVYFLSLQFLKNYKRYMMLSFIAIVLIFILSSVLFISASIKHTLNESLEYQPDFIIQKILAGQSVSVPLSWQNKLVEIAGVTKATPRVYGRYSFDSKHSALIIGVDFFDEQSSKSLEKLTDTIDLKSFLKGQKMLIGSGVSKYLKSHFYNSSYNFLTPNGEFLKVDIFKTLNQDSALLSNDAILVDSALAKKILGIKQNEVSDFALSVPNPTEQDTIKAKIESLYYNIRVVTKKQMHQAYESLYDYKGGLFLTLYLIVLFAFSLILYLRYSIATSIEKKEIGILRAIGWSVKDILKLKFLENLSLVIISYVFGVVIAYLYVFKLNAPILRDIFLGGENLQNSPNFTVAVDFGLLATIFIIYAIVFLSSVLIPIWRIAITDPKEAMR